MPPTLRRNPKETTPEPAGAGSSSCRSTEGSRPAILVLQEEAGLEVVTDGEMRRQSFQSQMTAAVEGFGEHSLDAFLWGDWHADPQIGNWVLERPSNLGVVGKLRRRRATSRQRSSPVCVRALAASPRLRCLLRPLGEFLVAQALRPRLSYTRVLLERCCSNPP